MDFIVSQSFNRLPAIACNMSEKQCNFWENAKRQLRRWTQIVPIAVNSIWMANNCINAVREKRDKGPSKTTEGFLMKIIYFRFLQIVAVTKSKKFSVFFYGTGET